MVKFTFSNSAQKTHTHTHKHTHPILSSRAKNRTVALQVHTQTHLMYTHTHLTHTPHTSHTHLTHTTHRTHTHTHTHHTHTEARALKAVKTNQANRGVLDKFLNLSSTAKLALVKLPRARNTYAHTNTQAHTHTDTNTHTNTHTHTHTNTHTQHSYSHQHTNTTLTPHNNTHTHTHTHTHTPHSHSHTSCTRERREQQDFPPEQTRANHERTPVTRGILPEAPKTRSESNVFERITTRLRMKTHKFLNLSCKQ